MHIGIFETEKLAVAKAAQLVVDVFSRERDANLGVATGSSPLGLYEFLRAAHADGTFDLSRSKVFALDEYVGIDRDNPESYRNVLMKELVGDDKTGLPEESLRTPNGQGENPDVAAYEFDKEIQEFGGIDLQILGIGADGHIGFNEPGCCLASRTHYEVLAAQTIQDNARFFGSDPKRVPTTCLTQGLGTIMAAKRLLLLAFGSAKAEAIYQLVEGSISARWPATIMQMHPNAVVLVDNEAASKLELSDLYQRRWEMTKCFF